MFQFCQQYITELSLHLHRNLCVLSNDVTFYLGQVHLQSTRPGCLLRYSPSSPMTVPQYTRLLVHWHGLLPPVASCLAQPSSSALNNKQNMVGRKVRYMPFSISFTTSTSVAYLIGRLAILERVDETLCCWESQSGRGMTQCEI